MTVAGPPIATRVASAGRHARFEIALPWLALAAAGVGLPLLDDSYVGVIAQRACIYWILAAGLNLVVGFAGQIAIGWVALLTIGAYTTAVLTAGTVTSALGSLSGARRERPGRRGVWRSCRAAGAPPAHLLLRDDDAGLCHHRHPGRTCVEERDRRRHRHTGAGVPLAFRSGLGFLLFLPRPCSACHLDDGQHRRQPVWPGPRRHPRRPKSPPRPQGSPSRDC